MLFANDRNIGPGHFKQELEKLFDHTYTKEDWKVNTFLKIARDHRGLPRIFPTFQGEGPFAGKPAIFVRLAGCNRGNKVQMGCEFCDADFRFDNGQWYDSWNLLNHIEVTTKKAFGNGVKPMVVITGGEPLLQAPALRMLCNKLLERKMVVQIESNGDFSFDGLAGGENGVFVVCSPKANPYPKNFFCMEEDKDSKPKYRYTEPDWNHIRRVDCLKFLVSPDPLSPYYDIPNFWRESDKFQKLLAKDMVYVSPIAAYKNVNDDGSGGREKPTSFWDIEDKQELDFEACRKSYSRATELMYKYGLRINGQLHLLFGLE